MYCRFQVILVSLFLLVGNKALSQDSVILPPIQSADGSTLFNFADVFIEDPPPIDGKTLSATLIDNTFLQINIRKCVPELRVWWAGPSLGNQMAHTCTDVENRVGATQVSLVDQPRGLELLDAKRGFFNFSLEAFASPRLANRFDTYPGSKEPQRVTFAMRQNQNLVSPFSCRINGEVVVSSRPSDENTQVIRAAIPIRDSRFDITCSVPIAMFEARIPTIGEYDQFMDRGEYVHFTSLGVKRTNEPSKLKMGAIINANASDSNRVSVLPTAIKDGDTITLPLGAYSKLFLIDDQFNVLPAKYELKMGTQAFFYSPLTPLAERSKGLFLDRVALMFPVSQAIGEQEMMPVHLGTQQLVITPSDSKISPITVTLKITAPVSVGGNSSQSIYDDIIVYNAHLRGIPPQVIKGVVAHESGFDPKAFRYEPASNDRKYFGKGKKRLAMKLYEPYIIKEPNSLVNTPTIAPRSSYGVILRNGSAVRIPNDYELTENKPLYCHDIVLANNTSLYGFKAQNWDKSFSANRIPELDSENLLFNRVLQNDLPKIQAKYSFIAQTVTASSYGLMQVLYYVAVEDHSFTISGTGINPTNEVGGLYNPGVNIFVGSRHLYTTYLAGSSASYRASVDSLDKLEILMRRGVQKYNGVTDAPTLSDAEILAKDYNIKVWNKSKLFYPAPSSTVFN